MINSKQRLGLQIKWHREQKNITQDVLAGAIPNTNRSNIAHLEQGRRLPDAEILKSICNYLEIPSPIWSSFLNQDSLQRFEFEEAISELVGHELDTDGHDVETISVAERHISNLFSRDNSDAQARDLFNMALIGYGVRPVSNEFFQHYFEAQSFTSIPSLSGAIENYQRDAIRLFSTLSRAYWEFNSSTDLKKMLLPIQPKGVEAYQNRGIWDAIKEIPDERLADLGYISAAKVKKQEGERKALQNFLLKLAEDIKRTSRIDALGNISEKQRRRMDSLLRQFHSSLAHGLFSPLFAPDSDEVEREAQRLAPKSEDQLSRMEDTQAQALQNLASYLTADYLDVYVATSMRSDADFFSVNNFVRALFSKPEVRTLKLRYFNPTQSWIEDRIAKGLVEALMLKRATVTIYMAQKSDTFGKDSEASVALGQGKPVIVYVPKLVFPQGQADAESLFKMSRADLEAQLNAEEREDIDESVDIQGIFSKVLTSKLNKLKNEELKSIAFQNWADFDLMEEADRFQEELRPIYRKWLDAAIKEKDFTDDFSKIREQVIGLFVANTITFEKRAMLFREMHPLALQVILSSGVLNGILVVRSVDQCGAILSSLIRNELNLRLVKDDQNYRLVEHTTDSTIRVISRHRLLSHAFEAHYSTTLMM